MKLQIIRCECGREGAYKFIKPREGGEEWQPLDKEFSKHITKCYGVLVTVATYWGLEGEDNGI